MRSPEGWEEVDGALERTFGFVGFPEAIAFVGRVAELAEAENHHPDIAISYREVTLRWRSHSADAITERDRELAERSPERRTEPVAHALQPARRARSGGGRCEPE